MRNHEQWFQSPLPKTNHQQNHQYEPQESHWNRHLEIYSPQPSSIFKFNNLQSQLSPWSKLLNAPDHRQEALSIPGIDLQQVKNEIIEQRLIFSQDQNDLVTPVRKQQIFKSEMQDADLHTTGKKSQAEINYSNNKSRPREKGLRKLSQRAFQIVKEFKNATYKQVAAKLVLQLGDEDLQVEYASNIQNKQQQNIKRRVYDALNVLIALGVLRKQGRKIVSDTYTTTNKFYQKDGQKDIQHLKSRIEAKQILLKQKRIKLAQARQKYQSLKRLQERNRCKDTEKNKIMIPFIVVMIPQIIHESISLTHKPHHKFTLCSQVRLQPFGDMDALKWLQLSPALQSSQNKQFS